METFSALFDLYAGKSPVNSPHKGQWPAALVFSLICARINDWVNNREAGDLRRHRTLYDVTVVRYSTIDGGMMLAEIVLLLISKELFVRRHLSALALVHKFMKRRGLNCRQCRDLAYNPRQLRRRSCSIQLYYRILLSINHGSMLQSSSRLGGFLFCKPVSFDGMFHGMNIERGFNWETFAAECNMMWVELPTQ